MLIKLKNLKCLIDSWYNKISNSKTYQKWSVIVFLFSLLCGGNSDPDQIYASSGSTDIRS